MTVNVSEEGGGRRLGSTFFFLIYFKRPVSDWLIDCNFFIRKLIFLNPSKGVG